jgi:hypothetical protein
MMNLLSLSSMAQASESKSGSVLIPEVKNVESFGTRGGGSTDGTAVFSERSTRCIRLGAARCMLHRDVTSFTVRSMCQKMCHFRAPILACHRMWYAGRGTNEAGRGFLQSTVAWFASVIALFGPSQQIAKIKGSGTIGFSDCTFVQWSKEAEHVAIQASTGSFLAQGHEFLERKQHGSLEEAVDRAVIWGNLFAGPTQIRKVSKHDVQIGLNTASS